MTKIKNLPQHIAVIMDGNGRWAKQRAMTRIAGHRAGIRAVRRLVRNCRRLGIKYLTIFAFSIENWRRPKEEVNALMELLLKFIYKEIDDLKKNGIKLKVIGDISRLPKDVRRAVRWAENQTRRNDEMVLCIALSYSGRDEILRATKRIAELARKQKIDHKKLSEESFEKYLDTRGIPDVDLLIRTSGEQRISNFLLWQIAYAEIYITPVLWPDFKKEDLMKALKFYSTRERRFGYTSEQIEEMKKQGLEIVDSSCP